MSSIILSTDDRYKYLPQLFEKYDYWNLSKYFPNFGFICYFIPPELVLEYGCNWNSSTEVYPLRTYNSSDSNANWVSCKSLSRFLNNYCKLTVQEYFDLLVLHINDTADRPRCPQCNNYLNWTYKFSKGYGSTGHNWDECIHKFCSPECRSSYKKYHEDEYPNDKLATEYWMKSQHDWRSVIKRMMNTYISSGNPSDLINIYLTWTKNGYLKFGICYDMYIRCERERKSNHDQYLSPHIIYKADRIHAAYIEAHIKLQIGGKEYLDKSDLPKLIKIIRSILNLKTINNPFN